MAQRLYRLTAKDMLDEDALSALAIDPRVPDVLRIHNNHWPVAALIHAACVIDADDALQPMLRRTLFQRFVHFL